jgi:hypothetical protein
MRAHLGLLACSLALSLAPLAQAQDPVLIELYGQGVHAYFAGNPVKAHDRFTMAIDAGYEDPRAFFYRGLSYLQLGRPTEADADFRRGAALEAANGDYSRVSKSMERIQGGLRLELEEYRLRGRVEALKNRQQLRRQRYRDIESGVIEAVPTPSAVEVPPPAPEDEVPPPPADEVPLEVEEPAMDDPMDEPLDEPAMEEEAPAPVKPKPTLTPEEEDPFGGEPAGEPDSSQVMEDEPVRDEIEEAEPFPKVGKPTPVPDKDAPVTPDAEEDPFGGEPAGEPDSSQVMEDEPVRDEIEEAEPFPNVGKPTPVPDKEEPATEEPAMEEPAAEEADPFAEEDPGTKQEEALP